MFGDVFVLFLFYFFADPKSVTPDSSLDFLVPVFYSSAKSRQSQIVLGSAERCWEPRGKDEDFGFPSSFIHSLQSHTYQPKKTPTGFLK